MTSPYSFTFDGTSKCYLPLLVSARVKLWDPISVMLKPQIEVHDSEGCDWLSTNKLRVINGSQKLIEAGRAAQFSLGIGPALSLQDILQANGTTEVTVTLYPDRKMVMPGSPIPIDVPPVTKRCLIRVPLPADLETDIDPFLALDKGGLYLSARVNLHLPSQDAETKDKIRDSISFTQRSGQIIIDQMGVKCEGDWKRVRVYPLPSNEHLVREQNNLVEVRASVVYNGKIYEELSTTVVLPLDSQTLELSLEPQAVLKVNYRDAITARASFRFSESFPPSAADRDALITGLQLQFDPTSSGWLTQSGRMPNSTGATWMISSGLTSSGSGQQSLPPTRADLTASTNLHGVALSASASLTLLVDPNSLELYSNPRPPLVLGDESGIWVYARVRKSANINHATALAATEAIQFNLTGPNSQILKKFDEQLSGDFKAVRVVASLSPGMTLSQGAGGITATTTVAGATLSESMELPIEQAFELHAKINGNSTAFVKFDPQKKEWRLAPIKAWFSLVGDDTAIKSGCALDASPLKTKDDLLTVQKIVTGPTSEVEIHLKLDAHRKEFEQLLQKGGRLEVDILGHSEDCKTKYRASVTLNFVVEYELLVEQVEGGAVLVEPRDYTSPSGKKQKCKLQIGQIVADGVDQIKLCIASQRKDKTQQGKRQEEAPSPADSRNQSSISLATITGPDSSSFELKPDPTMMPAGKPINGKFYYLLISKKPLLATSSRLAARGLGLRFELETKQPDGGKRFAAFEYKAEIRPIFLKLWIYPGLKRGKATAAALACIDSSKDGVIHGLECELAVTPDSAREPKLNLVGSSLAKIDEEGLAYWSLAYENLYFSNAAQAKFKVKCRPAGSPEYTSFTIDVDENGKNFLKLMDDRARLDRSDPLSLDLTNPEFNSNTNWLYSADYIIPNDVRGSFYNVRWLYYGDLPGLPIPLAHYTCAEMKKRLLDFGFAQRFGKDSCLVMNGIELGDYAMGYLHNFFGFNLSGNSAIKDAWFIDPWWRQRWDADEIAHSWKTEYWKCFWTVTFVLCELALLCMFIYVSGRALLPYVTPHLDKARALIPDFSKMPCIIRLRQALSRWFGGAEKQGEVYEYLCKIGNVGWRVFKYTLGTVGGAIMLHPRVRLDEIYFTPDADYNPTTLYRERDRLRFEKLRAAELLNDTSASKPVHPVEVWP